MSKIRYIISTDRADELLRTIIEHADEGELTIQIEKDWKGQVIFYLPKGKLYGEKGLHCVIRREELEITDNGVKQTISSHDKDIIDLEGHEIVELSSGDDYSTGIFLPRSIKLDENE